MGGNTQRDGITCVSWPSNVSSTSIEISEHIAPLRFHHKKLRPDSGGPGRHRAGRAADQRQAHRPEEAVRDPEGRRGFPRDSGRRRARRPENTE
ncbi:hydantoinase B/oxoprolinase family protein [Reyranella sp.]|uniref:hydantoinase B/oxoprolinase family protein n=1 Tax=Reyranella sp. TaxID=1929291 RepID=UPI003D1430EB